MKIFRIENANGYGMWYSNGSYNPDLIKISDKRLLNMPMEYDDKFHAEQMDWFCGVDSMSRLQQWFNKDELTELSKLGFNLFEIESNEYVKEDNQTLYTLRGIQTKTMLNILEVN